MELCEVYPLQHFVICQISSCGHLTNGVQVVGEETIINHYTTLTGLLWQFNSSHPSRKTIFGGEKWRKTKNNPQTSNEQ
jgi:hypothetical protein